MEEKKSPNTLVLILCLIILILGGVIFCLIYFKDKDKDENNDNKTKDPVVQEKLPEKEVDKNIVLPESYSLLKDYSGYDKYLKNVYDEMYLGSLATFSNIDKNTAISRMLYDEVFLPKKVNSIPLSCSDLDKYKSLIQYRIRKNTPPDYIELECDQNNRYLISTEVQVGYVSKYNINKATIDNYVETYYGPGNKSELIDMVSDFYSCLAIDNDFNCIDYSISSGVPSYDLNLNNKIVDVVEENNELHLYVIKYFDEPDGRTYSDYKKTNQISIVLNNTVQVEDSEFYQLNKDKLPIYKLVFKENSNNSYYWYSSKLISK